MGKLKWLFTEGVTDLTSYRLGQVQERERIIKLLEGIRADAFQWDELGVMTKGYDIALDAIKGEQK